MLWINDPHPCAIIGLRVLSSGAIRCMAFDHLAGDLFELDIASERITGDDATQVRQVQLEPASYRCDFEALSWWLEERNKRTG